MKIIQMEWKNFSFFWSTFQLREKNVSTLLTMGEKTAVYEFSQCVCYFLLDTVFQEAQLGDDLKPKADGL